jgi:hypothetical protein
VSCTVASTLVRNRPECVEREELNIFPGIPYREPTDVPTLPADAAYEEFELRCRGSRTIGQNLNYAHLSCLSVPVLSNTTVSLVQMS